MNRYLKGTLLATTAVLLVAFCFGMGLLVYALGEPKEIDLGTDEASFILALQEQLRLGHVALVEGGERVYVIGGTRYELHVLTVMERVGLALSLAFKGDYGQAVSQHASVGSLIGWPLGRTFIYLFAFGLFSFIPGFLALKEKNAKRAGIYGGIALFLLGLSLGFFLGWNLPYVGLAFFAGSLLMGLMCLNCLIPTQKPYVRSMVATLLFGVGEVSLFTLYPALNEGGSLLSSAVATSDNHLLGPLTFFLSLMASACIYLAIIFATRKKKEVTA